MNEKQRKDLERMNESLKRYDTMHKKWIEYANMYRIVGLIVCFVIAVLWILALM